MDREEGIRIIAYHQGEQPTGPIESRLLITLLNGIAQNGVVCTRDVG